MKLFLECKPDEALSSALGIRTDDIEHCQGRSKVCNKLNKHKSVKGLMDEDPQSAQGSYIRKLVLKEYNYDIKYLKDVENNNDIIILQPRLEDWILKVCHTSGINIREYSLSVGPKELHLTINTRLDKFKKLIQILQEREVKDIIYLKELLLKKIE